MRQHILVPVNEIFTSDDLPFDWKIENEIQSGRDITMQQFYSFQKKILRLGKHMFSTAIENCKLQNLMPSKNNFQTSYVMLSAMHLLVINCSFLLTCVPHFVLSPIEHLLSSHEDITSNNFKLLIINFEIFHYASFFQFPFEVFATLWFPHFGICQNCGI